MHRETAHHRGTESCYQLWWWGEWSFHPGLVSSRPWVMQASHHDTQPLHYISNTHMHKYLLITYLWANSIPAAGSTMHQESHPGGRSISTAPWTTPYQPRSDCSYFACQERDLKRLALPWRVTFTHFLIQGPTRSFHQLHISGVSSQVNVLGGDGEVTYQPRPGTLLMEAGDYSLGEGEDLGDGGDFNVKHYKNKKKLPFSQERLQTLLYQDKAPKPARSVFTKTASLQTAKPDFQSKQVPILAAALQTWPSIPPVEHWNSSTYCTRLHGCQPGWAQRSWHSHSAGACVIPQWFPILLQGCT